MDRLAPLPVALPLLAAAALAAAGKRCSRRIADGLALAVALATTAIAGALLLGSTGDALVHWAGGWAPRGGVALGISFFVDPLGAGFACLAAALASAALAFSIRTFDASESGGLFHALLLTFLAALEGFGLTGDLFNLFVFFELMGAAAIALCGFRTEEQAPVQGAFNFAVVNTIGAFVVLAGIGLLYARTGALNLAQIGRAVGGTRDDLVIVAFAFVASGFLVKAAVVPFHFWLADAHAVAPSPVCVLFSGIMVPAGLYAVARVHALVFATPLAAHETALRGILVSLGAATAVVGALMSFPQRHLKRLLAFSTIAHVGLATAAFGLLSDPGLAGAALYTLGHGLVKGALFLGAGIVLHRFETLDVLLLRGRGARTPWLGGFFALGGLALAGAPPFGTFVGASLADEAARAGGFGWLSWIWVFASAVTGAAVLRTAGGIFLGWGP
ncbi:MAG TPA: proton-conducting transporter membrane subunit, partial [Planctomycetota bacterium]|nr:proton-conducting transporter membrane subunit [Planctomycetota bacterium]